jgi:hypothetical protein
MLGITRIDTKTEQTLILEGRLTEPWIANLRSHWQETRHAYPGRRFLVDLRGWCASIVLVNARSR